MRKKLSHRGRDQGAQVGFDGLTLTRAENQAGLGAPPDDVVGGAAPLPLDEIAHLAREHSTAEIFSEVIYGSCSSKDPAGIGAVAVPLRG